MSALAGWCHKHRLVVLLAWVGLLFALVAGIGVAGTKFGNSTTAVNTDSARAIALLKQGASKSAGESGNVVWQVHSGTVTDASVQRAMTSALDGIEHRTTARGVNWTRSLRSWPSSCRWSWPRGRSS